MVLLGLPFLGDPDHVCVCTDLYFSDPSQYMWGLEWWPHAIAEGINPIVTDRLFAPEEINLAVATTVPGAALVMAPVTALLGPFVTYNVVVLLGPALAAWFAYLLCRHVTGRALPALVGGLLFGFSTYEMGQSLDHLNLSLVFPVPAAVHVTLLAIEGRIGPRRTAVLLGALVAFQYLLSPEIAFTMTAFGALALLVAWWQMPALRARIRAAAVQAVGGLAVAAVLVSPFLYYGLLKEVPQGANTATNRGDLLAFLVPTPLTWVGGDAWPSVSRKFDTSYTENGLYVGLILLAVVAWAAVSRWRAPSTRVLVAVLAVSALGSLGSRLEVAGDETLPLPLGLLSYMPISEEVSPVRLFLYGWLAIAVLVALWLAAPGRRRRWAIALLAVASIAPAATEPWLHSRPSQPELFRTDQYRRHIHPDDVVLVVPHGSLGYSMLWQAQADMNFKLAGGYVPVAPRSYEQDPLVLALISHPREDTGRHLRSFVARHDVGVIVIENRRAGLWPAVVEATGLRARFVGGVRVYRVPRAWRG